MPRRLSRVGARNSTIPLTFLSYLQLSALARKAREVPSSLRCDLFLQNLAKSLAHLWTPENHARDQEPLVWEGGQRKM
ncbi:hypothetical protein F5B17DRAFT_394942 [Nemania serpens]|nr:hypothetical protein F5B17DRAFT_394942 [Nemania serpens]